MAPSNKNQSEKLDFGTSVATHMHEAIPKSHSSTIAGFVTKSGISNSALNLSIVTRGGDWIINSGATDHMTYDPHKFINFSPNCSKTVIINANGISSPSEGVGTISLSPSLLISDVLFVPSLNCNLLSVCKLTKSHSCVAMVEREKDCIILKMSHNKPIKELWLVLRMNTYTIKTKRKFGYGIEDWDIPLLVI